MSRFKAGPLDRYRNKASCSVEDLQNHFDDEKSIAMRNRIWNTLERDPLFSTTEDEISGEMSLDEYRKLSHLRAKKICEHQFVTIENFMQHPLVGSALHNAVGMFNWDCITRYLLHLTVSIFFLSLSFFISPFPDMNVHKKLTMILFVPFPNEKCFVSLSVMF